MKYITYLIYVLMWDCLVIGGTGYAVFVLDNNGWWFLLAFLFSALGFSPEKWNKL